MALVAVAGLASVAPAQASLWWFEQDPIIVQRPAAPPPRPQSARDNYPKLPTVPKNNPKPQGPLVVAISLDRQNLKVYDSNGLFAESPVSTGMRSHATPTGVYSVIQRSKWHRSNIYSNAPMPFMQRLTWSGIAIHAGSLPGYPASHGCIRVPMAFAVQAWSWTRMGARVIITSGETVPVAIAHRLLPTGKPTLDDAPMAATDPAAPAAATKNDRRDHSDAGVSMSVSNLDLRPSLAPGATILAGKTAATLRAQTYLADAGAALPDLTAAIVSDAPASSLRSALLPTAAEQPGVSGAAGAGADADAAEVVTGSILLKDTPAAAATPDDAATTPASAPPAATTRKPGRIAAFISRKDGKLYVRENFEPLFDVPVTIADGALPLGTHVLTAHADKSSPGTLSWTAMSLLPDTPGQQPAKSRKRKTAAETTPPAAAAPVQNTATEALDRISIPDDAMKRLAELLTAGGSITVSDQGITTSRETGRGTDFVILLK